MHQSTFHNLIHKIYISITTTNVVHSIELLVYISGVWRAWPKDHNIHHHRREWEGHDCRSHCHWCSSSNFLKTLFTSSKKIWRCSFIGIIHQEVMHEGCLLLGQHLLVCLPHDTGPELGVGRIPDEHRAEECGKYHRVRPILGRVGDHFPQKCCKQSHQ